MRKWFGKLEQVNGQVNCMKTGEEKFQRQRGLRRGISESAKDWRVGGILAVEDL
jgi:hypothetical protein